MLGAIFAVLAVIVFGIIGLSPAGNEVMPPGAAIAGIALLVGYIVYAQRRSASLVKEEADRSREEADRVFERLRTSPPTTGISLRWRARTYVLLVVMLIATAASAAVGWAERSSSLLIIGGLVFIWALKTLLARLAEPVVLRIGPAGIEDTSRFGLIPWQDIERVFLHEHEIKGTKTASLSVGVRDPGAYSRRLGPIARLWSRTETLGFGDDIRFPLQALDMAPLAVFRLIRAFHERALPAGALSGTDNFYQVDIEGGKLNQLMAELKESLAESDPGSGAPSRRHQELMARMDALVKSDNERMSRTLARARKTNRAAIILAIAIGLFIALFVGAKVLG